MSEGGQTGIILKDIAKAIDKAPMHDYWIHYSCTASTALSSLRFPSFSPSARQGFCLSHHH